MKILGVDPGSHRTGWAVLAEAAPGRPPVVVASGTISLPAAAPLHERLVRLSREIGEIAERHRPDVVAMEESFFQKNARTALVLGHARGALIAGACSCGTPFAEYPPATVKKVVGGNGRASKEALARILAIQLGLTAPLDSLDASDALAVAWTHLQTLRSPLTAATAGKHGSAHKGFDVEAYLQRLSKMRQGA